MRIRKLTRDDAAAFRELRLMGLKTSPEAFSESHEEFAAKTAEETAELMSNEPGSPVGFVLGAFSDEGALVGCVGLVRERFAKEHHKAILWGMFVRPEERKQGLARQLVQALIEDARTLPNVKSVALNVATKNIPAVRLYEACGFKSFGTEPNALCIDGQYWDQEHMYLDL